MWCKKLKVLNVSFPYLVPFSSPGWRDCPKRRLASGQFTLHVVGWQPAGGGQHPLQSLIRRANGMCDKLCLHAFWHCRISVIIQFDCIRMSKIFCRHRRYKQFSFLTQHNWRKSVALNLNWMFGWHFVWLTSGLNKGTWSVWMSWWRYDEIVMNA